MTLGFDDTWCRQSLRRTVADVNMPWACIGVQKHRIDEKPLKITKDLC